MENSKNEDPPLCVRTNGKMEHAFLEGPHNVDLPLTTNCCGQYRNYHNLLWATSQLPQSAMDNNPAPTIAMDDVPTTIIWY